MSACQVSSVRLTPDTTGEDASARLTSRHSTAPPLGTRRPSRRAGNTRVLLTTRRSPWSRNAARRSIVEWVRAPVSRFTCSRREAPRTSGGSCAISSGGSSKKNSRTFIRESCYCAGTQATLSGSPRLVNDPGPGDRTSLAPRGGEDRPVGLIHVDAVAEERAAKHRFLHRAQLLQRAVAAAVLDRRFGFQAADAEDVEREVEHQVRAVREDARAPVIGADR